jgi:hypothetical protein
MRFTRLISLLVISIPALATAHIGVPSGIAQANKSGQKITFAINHGCDGTGGAKLDTLSFEITIPDGIDKTSVRAMPSDLDPTPVVTKTSTSVTSIKWSRDPADLQADDVAYYEVTFRAKVTDVPFTAIPFVLTQVCRPQGGDAGGADDVTVTWTGADANGNPEPSPNVYVAPIHVNGWNKITVSTVVANKDLGLYFGDAQIVWRGTEAFSPNMAVNAAIGMTPGVTPLTGDLAAGDEIWVKY